MAFQLSGANSDIKVAIEVMKQTSSIDPMKTQQATTHLLSIFSNENFCEFLLGSNSILPEITDFIGRSLLVNKFRLLKLISNLVSPDSQLRYSKPVLGKLLPLIRVYSSDQSVIICQIASKVLSDITIRLKPI